MARTTALAVKETLGSDYDLINSPSLTPSIDFANSLTTRVLAMALAQEEISVSAADAELLERLLGAHFACMNDPQYTSRSTLGASGSFRWENGKGLEGTTYGQNALAFDPTNGWLAAIVKKNMASGYWLGKPERDQLTYDERNL